MQAEEKSFLVGNIRGKQIFEQLLKWSEEEKYDDDYLRLLIEYQGLYCDSPNFDIFYAKYALFYKNYAVALEYAKKAEEKRRCSIEIWKILSCCYRALNDKQNEIKYSGLCTRYGVAPAGLVFSSDEKKRTEELHIFEKASGHANYAPGLQHRFYFEGSELKETTDVFAFGEFLPSYAKDAEWNYFTGAYCENEAYDGKGIILNQVKGLKSVFRNGTEYVFDMMRSRDCKEVSLDKFESDYILPVAGTVPEQKIQFNLRGKNGSSRVGLFGYSFFRITEPVTICSDEWMIVGKPIVLGHSHKRKKAVINILVDALSWAVIKKYDYKLIPNMMKFFSRGVIFDNHYSVSEYTYPSFATIETGMYPVNNKMQVETYPIELDNEIKTISEQLNGMGYYCTNLCGNGDGVYNGATRGHDRLVLNTYITHSYKSIERTIRQLKAFDECDQFIFNHFVDIHPMKKDSYQFPIQVQTHLPLDSRFPDEYVSETGIDLPHQVQYEYTNIEAIKDVDRNLKVLFDFLEENYSDDEYLVQVYSDHGSFVHDDDKYLLKEAQTNATYMLRGAGVPAKGIVDELTSTADIYQVMAKLLDFPVGNNVDGNLPEVFGGKRRDYVISSSCFPGQTFKLCIRTSEHEFRMESREFTERDCTADMSGAKCEIFEREKGKAVFDSGLMEYFMEIAADYVRDIDNMGHMFPSVKDNPVQNGTAKEV